MSNLPQTSTDGPIGSPPTTSIPLIHTNPSHKKVIIPVVSLFIFFIIVALLIIFKKKIVLFFRMRNINRTTVPPPPVGEEEAPQVAVHIASSNDESEEEEEEEEVVIWESSGCEGFSFVFCFSFRLFFFFPQLARSVLYIYIVFCLRVYVM